MNTILVPPVLGAIPFVDTSSHNEDAADQIDWPTLTKYLLSIHPEAGAIVKVSQGDWYVNPRLPNQRWGAHAAGLKNVGLYHYVELVSGGGPNQGKNLTGNQNAVAFISAFGGTGGLVSGEFLAGDWEDQSVSPTADLDAAALDFGGTLARALAIEPMLYSASWYADPHNLNRDPALAQFPAWWAAYQTTIPPVPEPWASQKKGIAAWQFTTQAVLPGMPFPCDVSWWLAGLPALRAIQWGYLPSPITNQPVDPPPTVAVNSQFQATDVNKAAQTISQELLAIYWQLSTVSPVRADQAGAAMQAKSNVDAIARATGLLS